MLRLKAQIFVDGRRFREIGAFANPDAGANQSITPNLFSERSQLRITLYISKSNFRYYLISNIYCEIAKY